MEDLIKKILQIEKDAQDIVQAARSAKENFSGDIEAQASALRVQIEQDAVRKISQLEEQEKAAVAVRLSEIQRDTDKKIQELDALHRQHAAEWAQQIFENITGS